jgi:hypothetical protein
MAKKSKLVEPTPEATDAIVNAPEEKNLAQEMAKYNRIPCMKRDEFEKMALALKSLGVKFELQAARSGQFKGATQPFAYKAKMLQTTFIVDLS